MMLPSMAEAVASPELKRPKGVVLFPLRREDRDLPERPEGAELALRVDAPLLDAEVELDGPCNGEVALRRVVDPFDHAKLLDRFGHDEVEVGVALAVDIGGLIERDVAELELPRV